MFVATDRISAFDYVLATGIPQKGRVLTQISLFWFEFLRDVVANHLITADVERYPEAGSQKYADQLRGRSMLVMRADMAPVECVVRGYISGSAWKEYKATGRVCGIELPKGLRESDRLPEPIFTPATKSNDRPRREHHVRGDEAPGGPELSTQLRDLSLAIYEKAAKYALEKGHHHRRYQVRVWDDCQGHHFWRTKCSPPTPRASGLRTSISRARPGFV